MVFTKGYLSKVVSYYTAVDDVKTLTEKEIKLVNSFLNARKNWKYFNDGLNESRIYNFAHWNRFSWEIIRIPGISYMDVERYILYNFDEKAKISYPVIPDVSLDKYRNMDFNKTIIINPYSNFLENHTCSIFETITDTLLSNGYDVYTNVIKEQKVLKGTKRLDCPLEDLYTLSKKVKLVISLRSGIVDFMINSGGRFVVIYPDKTQWDRIFRQAYTLEAWQANSECYEYSQTEIDEILIRIYELLDI